MSVNLQCLTLSAAYKCSGLGGEELFYAFADGSALCLKIRRHGPAVCRNDTVTRLRVIHFQMLGKTGQRHLVRIERRV